MSTKSLNERVTIQFGESRRKVYNDFMEVVKKESIPKSTAGYLLLEKGILHRNNPEPLIKEVEKKVYIDRPGKTIEKKVYVDRPVFIPAPNTEHIINKALGQANAKGKRASDDKLTNPNEAKSDSASSKLALEEKKSSNGSNIWCWVLGLSVTGLVGWGIYNSFTS